MLLQDGQLYGLETCSVGRAVAKPDLRRMVNCYL